MSTELHLAEQLSERLAFTELAPGTAYKGAAINALRATLAIHRPVRNGGVCNKSTCPCWKPEWLCGCGLQHDDYRESYPCATVLAVAESLGVFAEWTVPDPRLGCPEQFPEVEEP